MHFIEALVEQRIQEAQARGEFDDLPGAGRPLPLDDEPLVPEELRVAYRMLKNAGFVPPEVEQRAEIHALAELVARATEPDERTRALRRLQLLSLKLAEARPGQRVRLDPAYQARILERLR
jgi:hypothetical protein